MALFDTIDITKSTLLYDQLVKHIDERVLETQQQDEYRILPNIIIMTKRQQKMLRRYKHMGTMHGSTTRYWLTPHNLMAVVVKELV